METLWALFPLMMQAVYTFCGFLPLRKLHEGKRSDQHALAGHAVTLGAHGAMLAWAALYAKQAGMVLSFALAIVMAATTFATVLYYRHYPGGRTVPLPGERAARRALRRLAQTGDPAASFDAPRQHPAFSMRPLG